MRCPACDSDDTAVIDTRHREVTVEGRAWPGVARRRRCGSCGHRFSTVEIANASGLSVGKRLGAKKRKRRPRSQEEAFRRRIRADAREQAAETGEDLLALYARWGVLSPRDGAPS